jgi:hypothetical protein
VSCPHETPRATEVVCTHKRTHTHIHTFGSYIHAIHTYIHIYIHGHTCNAHQREISVSSPHAQLDGIRGSNIPSCNGLTDQNPGAQIVSPLSRCPQVAPLPSVQDSLQSTLGARVRRHFVPRSAQTPARLTARAVGSHNVPAPPTRGEANGTGMSRDLELKIVENVRFLGRAAACLWLLRVILTTTLSCALALSLSRYAALSRSLSRYLTLSLSRSLALALSRAPRSRALSRRLPLRHCAGSRSSMQWPRWRSSCPS